MIIFSNILFKEYTEHGSLEMYTRIFIFRGKRTFSLVPEYFPFYTNKCKVWRVFCVLRKGREKKILKEQTEEKFPSNFLCSWNIPFYFEYLGELGEPYLEDKVKIKKKTFQRVIIVRARAPRKRTRYPDICILQHIRGRNTIQLGARPRISWLDPVGIILALRVDRIIAC